MARVDVSDYTTFDQITDRLDQIVSQVKSKDTSIEHSLELFDEAIALGSKAVDMVDTAPLGDAEKNEVQREAGSEGEGSPAGPDAASDAPRGDSLDREGDTTPKPADVSVGPEEEPRA